MSKIICPGCGNQVKRSYNTCPYCGTVLHTEIPYNRKKRRIAVGIAIAIGITEITAITASAVKDIYNQSLLERDVKREQNSFLDKFQKKTETTSPKKMSEPDAKELTIMAKEAVDSYNNGELTYDEAAEKLASLNSEYSHKVEDYETIVSVLQTLKASKDSFNQAVQYEESGEYKHAYESYAKVINEDKKYEEAKQGEDRAKNSQKEEYKKEAKEKADGKDYTAAITVMDSALLEFPKEEEFTKLKQEYENLKDKAQKALDEKFALEKGKVIKTDSIKATFKGASFTTTIKPDDTSDSYRYYKTKDSSKIWLDLKFTVKNWGKETFDLATMVSDMQLLVDAKKSSVQYGAYSSSGSSLSWVGDNGDLKSGKSVTYHLIVEVPKELKSSKESVEVKFYLDGEKQDLNYR